MREEKAKRPPLASTGTGEPESKQQVGSREHVTREAVRKDKRSVEAAISPGPPPDPGLEEDYGKRSGDVPSQEPAGPKKDENRPT